MLDDYKISKEVLENIASEYKECGDCVLDLDEINDMTMHINERFQKSLGIMTMIFRYRQWRWIQQGY